jgi:rRNA-processing protein EBP2
MAKKSKLLAALDAHKGRDYEAEKRKDKVKAAEKRKSKRTSTDGKTPEEKDDEEETTTAVSTIPQPTQPADDEEASDLEEEEEEEDDEDVPVSDLEDEDLEDAIPHQRMTINNGSALIASRDRIAVVQPSYKFHLHNSLISNLPPASASIADPNDDLTRELEFYRIAREAAVEARQLLKKEKVPFSRPTDYFAEMVKSDEHMGRIKQKMYDDAASKKAGEEARKLRDAKKYGKAVQVAKEQERAKEKRNTLDKIKELKRSTSPSIHHFKYRVLTRVERKGQDTGKVTEGEGGDDLFQSIDVENDPTKDQSGRERGGPPGNVKRQKRDQKFGFGGKKRFSKSGDAASSADMRGFSAAKMKGKPKRPGKSRRAGAH